jgi:17beta-estradiol 17-dehydrogenase / very-long-chain 3-oxoacyl-CoA reductase
MAKKMSKDGMKVLLISRNPERLKEAAAEMPGTCETLSIDFSGDLNAKTAELEKALAGKDIGVLVNNVGMGQDHFEYFDQIPLQKLQDLVKLNVESVTYMSRIVLPHMINKEKSKGAIVNVSSGFGLLPGGATLQAQYGGTKGYVIALTQAMAHEYSTKNIDVQCQLPMYVCSKLSKLRKPAWNIPAPDTYARSAVGAIGYDTLIAPYWGHYHYHLISYAPQWLLSWGIFPVHKSMRDRALKKKAEQQKKE